MKINSISKILCIIFAPMLLTGFKDSSSTTAAVKDSSKGIWSIPTGVGMHWKPKAQAINHAWMGGIATAGIKWEKRLRKRTIASGQRYASYKAFVHNCFKLMPYQALHAAVLGFKHPVTATALSFKAPLPKNFIQLIEKWEKYLTFSRC